MKHLPMEEKETKVVVGGYVSRRCLIYILETMARSSSQVVLERY